MTGTQSPAQWVESALVSLLSAPHISIPRFPGVLGGPGPIDLFSTRFNNTFTADATGVVDGDQVDREGLKQKLLALQTHFNSNTVTTKQEPDADYNEGPCDASVSLTWTTSDTKEHKVIAAATVVKQSGADTISSLILKGQRDLFVKPDSS